MRLLKMLGFATLTALMAVACVGISSAGAESTALCTFAGENEVCPSPSLISHVHLTTAELLKARLLSSSEVECSVLALGDVTQDEFGKSITLGAPLRILVAFTYSNCSGECTAKEENGPSELQVLREGFELATVTSGSGTWASLVNLVCTPFKISCEYVGTGLVGHARGFLSAPELTGEVTFSKQTVIEEGGKSLCPDTAKLDITLTPLLDTFITK